MTWNTDRQRIVRYAAEGRCVGCSTVKPDVHGRYPLCDACRRLRNQRRADAYHAAREAGRCGSCKTWPTVPHERFDIFCARCLRRYLAWEQRRRAKRPVGVA